MTLPVTIRNAHDLDWGFVANSWLMSYMKRATVHERSSSIEDCRPSELKQMARRLVNVSPPRTTSQTYLEYQNRMIERVLSRASVLVACSLEDSDQLIGHVVYDTPDVLHYVYVKVPFRKLGVARSLVETALSDAGSHVVVTHWAPLVPKLVRRKITYNPYRGFYDFCGRPSDQGSEAKTIS